jgi:two-component system nitrate/nitrite response regulator NarL
MAGYPNKVIARKLDVCEATVKVHVKAILRKLNVCNRTQAALWANSHGIHEPVLSS